MQQVGGDIFKPGRTKYQIYKKQRVKIFVVFKKQWLLFTIKYFLLQVSDHFFCFKCPLRHWHVFMCIFKKCHWNIDPYLNYKIDHDHSLLLLLVNDLESSFDLLIFSSIKDKKYDHLFPLFIPIINTWWIMTDNVY